MLESDNTLVLYPRVYNKRGQEHLHSVQGMTEFGTIVNVKLRLTDELKESYGENAPSISEFSRTDIMAHMPCVASDDNGPSLGNSIEGMLFFKGVVEEKEGVYIAEDARVIRSSSKDTMPIFGVGRLDISKDSHHVIRAKRALETTSDPVEIDNLNNIINDPRKYLYRAIMYYYEESKRLDHLDHIKKTLIEMIDKYTDKGVVGGVLVKCYDHNNRVIKDSAREIFSMFNSEVSSYQNGYDVWNKEKKNLEDISEEIGGSISSILMMPIAKYNCGAKGNKEYGKRFKKHKDFFYEGDQPMAGRIIVTLQYNEEGENILLSKVHTRNQPRGRIDSISSDGLFTDLLDEDVETKILKSALKYEKMGYKERTFDSIFIRGSVKNLSTNDLEETSEQNVTDVGIKIAENEFGTEYIGIEEENENSSISVDKNRKNTGMLAFMKNIKRES